ncbi:uncharacterized protein LOC107771555 isoform X1 [Nicotiana tabacum]|uniref:DPH4 homolog isoform X1 n=5 Tax=Nicotiana TaxID=4085 RepID=A0A1S3Y2T0_TOBAC|nr:PREDICTED: DPH4 homolog isoform X1 [Nicotiana sylvestris]XP_009789737.1 PREDICTED: DPH4 homolog isoform X1 [Nicotiana sylvestris]XP_009789738.1 PREDICTED: DPH4 homolog isoform X1 [Nicotiana sylvestris]XP_009789739.1 PREDICTED: DPH4 homolog isoform X1 [Nicotiana sylvestris]XP_016446434.1 PREDICTED: DPH4 homolog isoform X1 [Nicotiana tabacum]XP_016446435.1 PREDICTED: DPH4 homolog isoform X1 [Nicotiana tabacum]XP_016446436.1 PREDICTED: DPH4 homolog isoform X1 [Nicotiana tabacum]XP_016446437.
MTELMQCAICDFLIQGAMISSSNFIHKTHYEILGVKEDADFEEIRKAYRSAILCFHPDKQQKPSETSNFECLTENKFLEIQRAWETLGNPRSRALYDSELLVLRQDVAIAEDVSLEDLTVQDSGDIIELSCPCRCGDYYFIDSFELADTGCSISRDGCTVSLLTSKSLPASIVLPCGSCSLKVRLLINGDTRLHKDVHL